MPTTPPSTSHEVRAEHVTVSVAHVYDPAAIEPAQMPVAAVTTEREPAVQLPPPPHPGYRPCGRPPWGEP